MVKITTLITQSFLTNLYIKQINNNVNGIYIFQNIFESLPYKFVITIFLISTLIGVLYFATLDVTEFHFTHSVAPTLYKSNVFLSLFIT